MILLLSATFIIIVLSFLSSSMEAALFTVSFVQIEQMIDKGKSGALRLKANKDKIQDSIIAIVILNNLSNISGSILVGSIASTLFNDVWLGVYSGVLTFVIILAGEVIPKTLGERYAPGYARRTANIVFVMRMVMLPAIAVIRIMVRPVSVAHKPSTRTSEEHIKTLAKLGHRYGTILDSENQLIRRIFHLNDILAKDIMTPRTVVTALHADMTLGELEKDLYKSPFSRFPVYGEDHDDIIGVAHIRDLLEGIGKGKRDVSVREFTEEVSFVPEAAKADQMLRDFQRNREHFAVVIDEYGGTAGVVTLEDILEQLVGEIVDEYDNDVDMRVKARALKERKEGDYENG
jgi:magnesium and cobalt exporter, CNNM family